VSQGNRPAVGRRLQAVIDVVHAFEFGWLPRVDFENDALSLLDPRLVVADGRTRDHPAIFQHRGDLDQRQVELAQESVLHELSYVGQVDVHVLHFAGVDALAGFGIGLIGQPEMNAASHGERAVELRTSGGAGEDADLELLSAQVGVGNAARQRQGHGLGIAGAGKSAHSDLVAGVDQGGRVFRAHDAVHQTGIHYARGGGNRREGHHKTFPTREVAET
jgi:hypothetical protein